MIPVKPDCRENAIGMLRSRANYFRGWVGDVRYYVVDGVAWSHTLAGAVARAETPEETDSTVAMVRHFNRP